MNGFFAEVGVAAAHMRYARVASATTRKHDG
jgi:hypothetical protein